MGDKTVNKLC